MEDNSITKQFPAERPAETAYLPPAGKKTVRKAPKTYILYCVMTLSVMLFTLAFAASELFSLFFAEVYPGKMIMSKLFGSEAGTDKSLQEIILNQSFSDLSFGKGTAAVTDNSVPTDAPGGVTVPLPADTSAPDTDNSTPDTGTVTAAPPVPLIPDGMIGIIPMDLSSSSYGLNYIHNTSKKTPQLSSLGVFDFSTDVGSVYPAGAPIVLIVHTHGTEAFTAEGVDYYDPGREVSRSSDITENVVALGKTVADYLNSKAIPTLHCETMHDRESYGGSYSRSADTIKAYLERYPSIQYVIDIHRDAIVKSSGELVSPEVMTSDGSCAQVMCVVGAGDDTGAEECRNWLSNLALAQRFREAMGTGVCRPTCLRGSSYNQQYGVYSMLLEIGAAGNTLAQAQSAALRSAQVLAGIIKGK